MASPDPLLGCLLDGRYRVGARLGSGGVGAVYHAEHVEMRRPVALKVLHRLLGSDEFVRRFEREARAASRLSHPACVSVLDFGRLERIDPASAGAAFVGMPYLVMEFVRGETLAARLGRGPMAPAEAVLITRGVLSALRHAHGLGLVHRDVKPANIMLTDGGATGLLIKLLDFGLAKDLQGEGETITEAGMIFGTPSYISPDQAAGVPLDARSDLYSVGVVLFEMLCGRRPFCRTDPLDTVRDHLETAPPRPRSLAPWLSAELEAAVLRALCKRLGERFQAAAEFQAALDACPESRPSAVPAGPMHSRRRRLLVIAAAAALLVVALAAGLARFAPRAPASSSRPQLSVAAQSRAAGFGEELLRAGRIEEAMAAARAALKRNPHDGRAHALLGGAYQRKLWCSDALEELERAVREDAALRGDSEIARRAIGCLGEKTQGKAIRFLVETVGATATAPLEQASRMHPSREVRHGAARALERLK